MKKINDEAIHECSGGHLINLKSEQSAVFFDPDVDAAYDKLKEAVSKNDNTGIGPSH